MGYPPTRFVYANGRPLGYEFDDYQGTHRNYYRFDWHGDTGTSIDTVGDGANGWIEWGPWGNFGGSADYYTWGGAWGYLHFVEFDQTDGANGLYYIHGRWYSPDTGLFLSPDERGEYFYGSGQNAVNWAWEKAQQVGGCAIDFGSGTVTQFTNDQTLGLFLGVAWYFGVEPRSNECIDTGRVTGRIGSEALSTYLTAQGIIDIGTGATGVALSLACAGGTGGICTPVAAVGGTTSLVLVMEGTGEAVYGGAVLKHISDNPLYFAQPRQAGGDPTLSYGTNTGDTGKNAEILRRNMGQETHLERLHITSSQAQINMPRLDEHEKSCTSGESISTRRRMGH